MGQIFTDESDGEQAVSGITGLQRDWCKYRQSGIFSQLTSQGRV
jgi:hypothetical protein